MTEAPLLTVDATDGRVWVLRANEPPEMGVVLTRQPSPTTRGRIRALGALLGLAASAGLTTLLWWYAASTPTPADGWAFDECWFMASFFLAPAFTLGGDRLARFWASGQVGPTISIGAAVTVDGTDWGALLRVETSRDECRVRLVLDDAHRDVRVRGPHDAVALAALLDAAVPNPSSAPPDAG